MCRESNRAIRVLCAALLVAWCAAAQESRAASRPVADTKAILAARAQVTRAEQTSGADSADVALALDNLALTLRKAGRTQDAISPARSGVSILERNPASTRAALARGRMVLAVVLHDAYCYAEALPVARAAADDAVAGWGDEDPQTVQAFFVLGGIAKMGGKYEEAEAALRRALRAEEVTEPIMRVQILDGLGEVLNDLGKFAEARTAFSEAGAIIAATEGVPPGVHAYHEGVVGLSDEKLGRWRDARPHFERQVEIVRGMKPLPQAELGLALHNFARAVEGLGDSAGARPLQDEALVAFSKEPRDARVTDLLADAARTTLQLGEFEQSAAFADRILAFQRANGDTDSGRRGRALLCAASAKHGMGRPEESLPLFDEAHECLRRASAFIRVYEGHVLASKGRALWALGRTREARACFRSAMNAVADALVARSAMLSEAERSSFFLSARGAFDLWLESAADDASEADAVASDTLSWKGRVLRAMQTERSALRARETPEVAALQVELADVQRSFASIMRQPGASRPSLDRLTAERERIERALARLVTGGSEARRITPADVSNALDEDEALVDYVSHRRWDLSDPRGTSRKDERLLAIVYRRGRPPRVIPIGPVAAARDATEAHLRITAKDVRPDPAAETLARTMAAATRDAVWSPVVPALDGARRVFIVPDGFLAALPFETLPTADGARFIFEDLEITYLLGVQDRLDPLGWRSGGSALLVGDVDYGPAVAESREGGAREGLGLSFTPLPRTKQEIEAIASALSSAGVPPERVFRIVGREATEGRVKTAMAGMHLVHIASHGVFLRDGERGTADEASVSFRVGSAFSAALPALRSGIALAGANASGGGGDDGLLTAAEIAWCDLSACDLAVISSCESGLGVPRAGDSVLGLRRSLRLAGARSSVTALWRVDDAAAADLMRAFYEALLVKKHSRAAALREAKLQALRAARAAGSTRGNPGTWGAFVLDGGWK